VNGCFHSKFLLVPPKGGGLFPGGLCGSPPGRIGLCASLDRIYKIKAFTSKKRKKKLPSWEENQVPSRKCITNWEGELEKRVMFVEQSYHYASVHQKISKQSLSRTDEKQTNELKTTTVVSALKELRNQSSDRKVL